MTKRIIRWQPLVLFVALWSAGCTLSLHSAGGKPPSTPAPPVRLVSSVEVRAGKSDQSGRTVSVSPYDVRIDYAEFAGDAVKQLSQAISQQGGADAGGASKSLELVVMYVDILRTAGSFSCLIDYRITMGDGAIRGLQAREASWNFETACRAAVGDVAGATLRDPSVVGYLGDSDALGPRPAPTSTRKSAHGQGSEGRGGQSASERLKELKSLRDDGLITPEQYEQKSAEILKEL